MKSEVMEKNIRNYRAFLKLKQFIKPEKIMLAINGIYEDGKINPLQDIPVNENYIVRITFLKPLANADKDNAESFLRAAESSLDFWDNEIDDEIWNNV